MLFFKIIRTIWNEIIVEVICSNYNISTTKSYTWMYTKILRKGHDVLVKKRETTLYFCLKWM